MKTCKLCGIVHLDKNRFDLCDYCEAKQERKFRDKYGFMIGMKILMLFTILLTSVNCYAMNLRKETTSIIIHHSATEQGSVEIFRRYHVNVKKWDDIGYHFVLLKNGTVEVGRSLGYIGAHATGMNKKSIGVCMVGKGKHSLEQLEALKALVNQLKKMYGGLQVLFHHEDCPNQVIRDYVNQNIERRK